MSTMPLESAGAVSVETAKPDTNGEFSSSKYEIDPIIDDEERRFYYKAYPTIDMVNNRKVHCTVCRSHIGTAVAAESNIKMHPILRVTHCIKCHDFYNSGEFSKGEDGSELYCRWCGQGGEVYCCSNCPYVFCKSCIVKNLSRGVVADIEQNENWNCFNCAPKILWPLRAQHWALINYIEAQKKFYKAFGLTDSELRSQIAKDHSQCCRLAKSKANSMSDSLESLESNVSKRSQVSANSTKRTQKSPGLVHLVPKRLKLSNDEVVCTPDLLSMLEPDCQLTVAQKTRPPINLPLTSTPKIMTIQMNTNKSSAPPPLVLANTSVKMRQITQQPNILRRSVVGVRPTGPNAQVATSPVYHTINGYRIDLNTAAQQETFRLPNGKLIQVKRQGSATAAAQPTPPPLHQPVSGGQLLIRPRTVPPTSLSRPAPPLMQNNVYSLNSNISVQRQPQPQPQLVRIGNVQPVHGVTTGGNGTLTIQAINGAAAVHTQLQLPTGRPQMVRHVFPNTPIGQARTQLQDQVFNAMEICTHLTGKVQTYTNSNAYKQARNYLELKELYIHLSYLVTYAIGRFKGLQDKCLADMRQLGFVNDADSLENGQLAAAVDYVCYGQLDEVDLFNTGSNSFHNQVYEYRKSLHANLKDGETEPLPPLLPLGVRALGDPDEEDDENDNDADDWTVKDDIEDNENDEPEDSYFDNEGTDELDGDDNGFTESSTDKRNSAAYGTEESMTRDEQAHAYDRKLTRLLRAYPSIWCTKTPDYGNFEVTRKQWRVVASHFKRGDNIKLRWKNIRKRFVRIERRIRQGKRFNGYFDKATNFLANRDLPENEWRTVDCGDDDGDVFERKELDAIENTLNKTKKEEVVDTTEADAPPQESVYESRQGSGLSARPIEVRPIDERIINFAKSHPVLWRKSCDPQFDSIDEQTRKSLWANFWKSMPNYRLDFIIERWQQMYEMYKSFRLKIIRDKASFANLELKYSKYLAKLYFLYKIDEEDLRSERDQLPLDYSSSDDEGSLVHKLQDMPDDKNFLLQLVQTLRAYPTLWNSRHVDYNDTAARARLWPEVANKLQFFKRDVNGIKQRWQLAKYAYYCYRRELNRQRMSGDSRLQRLTKNLPIDEMRSLIS